jgi:hypothetical protein
MTPPFGVKECPGCSRLFKMRNPAEARLFDTHNCDDWSWEHPFERIAADLEGELNESTL